MAQVAGLMVKIQADTKGLAKGLNKANKQMSGFKKTANGMASSLGLAFGAYAIGGVIKKAIKLNIDFEKSMADIWAVSRATVPEMGKLKKLAIDLGSATEFTALQIAQLEKNFAKLGLTTNDIVNLSGATLDLATATGEDLAESGRIAVAVLNSFNAEAKDGRKFMDVMAASFSSSALDLEKFSSAMSNVGATANAFHWSIERTTAMLGILADNNIEASKSGTDLRKIIADLAKNGMTLEEALGKISNSTNKVATAQEMFGQRAFTSAIILANNSDKLREYTTELENASGSLGRMAAIQRDTLSVSLDKLASAWDGLMISMGEGNGILKIAVDYITDLITGINTLTSLGGIGSLLIPGRAGRVLERQSEEARRFQGVWQKVWDELEAGSKELGISFEQYLGDNLKNLDASMRQLGDRGDVIDALKVIKDGLLSVGKAAKKAGKGLVIQIDTLASLKEAIEANNDLINEGSPSAKQLVIDNRLLTEKIRLLKVEYGLIRDSKLTRPEKLKTGSTTLEGGASEAVGVNIAPRDYTDEFEALQASWAEAADRMKKVSLDMSNVISGAFQDMANTVATALSAVISGSADTGDILNAILGVIARFLKALGAAMIAAGTASEAFKDLLGSGPAAIAAGIALVILSGVVSSMLKKGPSSFAEGGIVTGPTLAMVGDNRSGTEAIIPLEKFGQVFGESNSSSQPVVLDTVIKGGDLWLLQKRYGQKLDRYT